MKLGLITDIHNDAIRLRQAVELLADHKVDQIITIGDTFDPLAEPEGMAEVACPHTRYRTLSVHILAIPPDYLKHPACWNARTTYGCYVSPYPHTFAPDSVSVRSDGEYLAIS